MAESQTGGQPLPHGHVYDPHLAHHFDTPQQQFESGKLGMWIFLATEVLLFSGLFCAYSVYRANHPEVFRWAHVYLNVKLGATNTMVLITSSLSMAWAVRAAQLGQQRTLRTCLAMTLVGAVTFLGIKYVEYKNKWEEGLLWAGKYHPTAEAREFLLTAGPVHPAPAPGMATSAAASAPVAGPTAGPGPQAATTLPSGLKIERSQIPLPAVGPAGLKAEAEPGSIERLSEQIPKQLWWFFGIYFLMTGLHGLHVIAGMTAISWVLARSVKGQFGPAYYTPVDLVGLYWHLVDIIWIFLFPLLYLVR